MMDRAQGALTRIVIAREVALCLLAFVVYFGVRGLTEGRVSEALAHGRALMRLEQALRIDWERAWQQAILGRQEIVDAANWVYIWGHWPLIVPVAVWLLLRHPASYFLVRNAFLISGALGLVVFATYPVAPPRLADAALVDTVTRHSNAYRVLQPPAFTNQYAALPSLHFGWNLLVGIVLVRQSRRLVVKLLGWVTPPAMALATILTANHYVIDVIAGALFALCGLLLAWYVRWLRRQGPLRVRRGGSRPGRPALSDGPKRDEHTRSGETLPEATGPGP